MRTPDAPGGDVLALDGAAVSLGNRTLWSGFDLRVGPAEFVAVLGPNGVGKSTLLQVILGTVPPSAGIVRVLGGPPGAHNDRIGYLPQRRGFDPSVRIRGVDLVRLGLTGTRFGVTVPLRPASRRRHRDDEARIASVIERVGAAGYADRAIGHLSGGEQQRLLIAQALVRRPDLLLLDEPLDSLDLPNQAAVAALIGSICCDEGVSVLIVAHDVNPILPYLDRVVYIGTAGVASGPPGEVITSATLSRLYGTPVEVLRTGQGRLVVVGQPDMSGHHHGHHGGLIEPGPVGPHDHDHHHDHGHGQVDGATASRHPGLDEEGER
ncbi:MAG: ATP-binding cassette domain-containing protein [Actinomycetota bacterium]|jgi:zinc/manganese transport system ATP-binding protein|nr:ATP-binding cassette domain-containing protein [Actinomycetota bacterium]